VASRHPVNSTVSVTVAIRPLADGTVSATSPTLPGLRVVGPEAGVRQDLPPLLAEMISQLLLRPVEVVQTGEIATEDMCGTLLLFESTLRTLKDD
jgi:hypothetical protein